MFLGDRQLNQKLESVCLRAYQLIKSRGGYKISKTFFVSQAYDFFQDLVHLHCKQMNEFLRKRVKELMIGIQEQSQAISISDIRRDMKECGQQKKSAGSIFLSGRVERLMRFLLVSECQGKNRLQLQSIELQLQCSLNYSCPKCIRASQTDGPKSMKLIDLQTESQNPKEPRKEPMTMKFIEVPGAGVEGSRQNLSKFDNVLQGMRKQKLRQLQLRRRQNFQIRKMWGLYGVLLQLQREQFEQLSQYVDKCDKKQELYRDMCLRNITNEKMINRYCQRIKKVGSKKLDRSLSVKADEQNRLEDVSESKKRRWSFVESKKKRRAFSKEPMPYERGTAFHLMAPKKLTVSFGSSCSMPVVQSNVLSDPCGRVSREKSFRLKAVEKSFVIPNIISV